jgi:ferredoxin
LAIEVRINTETCMGSGNCAFWAPRAFDLDDNGTAVVLDPNAEAEGCPTRSITVIRDGEPAHP